MDTHSSIDRLDLAGVRLAINLAETNLPSIKPDYQASLKSRIDYLRDRERRLTSQSK